MDNITNGNFDTEAEFIIFEGVLRDSSRKTGTVVIPEGVIEIGEGAFKGCTELTSVVIPEGVREIGPSAFFGCRNLASVAIPGSVTVIGRGFLQLYLSDLDRNPGQRDGNRNQSF